MSGLDIERLRFKDEKTTENVAYPFYKIVADAQLAKTIYGIADWLVDTDTVGALPAKESVETLDRLARYLRHAVEQANTDRPT